MERLKGTGSQYLLVEHYPIVRVASIKQAGEEIDPGLYDIATQGRAGVICKDDGWTYYGYPQGLTGDPVAGSRNIEVKYTAAISCHGRPRRRSRRTCRRIWRGWSRRWSSTPSGSWKPAALPA